MTFGKLQINYKGRVSRVLISSTCIMYGRHRDFKNFLTNLKIRNSKQTVGSHLFRMQRTTSSISRLLPVFLFIQLFCRSGTHLLQKRCWYYYYVVIKNMFCMLLGLFLITLKFHMHLELIAVPWSSSSLNLFPGISFIFSSSILLICLLFSMIRHTLF